MSKNITTIKAVNFVLHLALLVSNVLAVIGFIGLFCLSGADEMPETQLIFWGAIGIAAMCQTIFCHDRLKAMVDVSDDRLTAARVEIRRKERAIRRRQQAAAAAMADHEALVKDFERHVGHQANGEGKQWVRVRGERIPSCRARLATYCSQMGYPYLTTYDGTLWFRYVDGSWRTTEEVTENGQVNLYEVIPGFISEF